MLPSFSFKASRGCTQVGITALTLFLFVAACSSLAQAQDLDIPSVGVFVGGGVQHDGGTTGAMQVGASFEQVMVLEVGFIGPFRDLGGGSAMLSAGLMPSWLITHRKESPAARTYPFVCQFATVGYARLLGTGNAVDFGTGFDLRLNERIAIRFEGRDYMTLTPVVHNAAFRIGLRRYVQD